MTQRGEWDRIILPKMGDLKVHERNRLLELQCAFDLANVRVRNNHSRPALAEPEFWLPARSHLLHPLSLDWTARRGRARTPRSLDSERYALDLAGAHLRQIFSGARDRSFDQLLTPLARTLVSDDVSIRAFNICMNESQDEPGVRFPPFHEVPRLLEDLLDQYARTDLPPIGSAVGFLAAFLNIHPLEDGNGRCGRAIFSWLSHRSCDNSEVYIPLRRIIEISEGGFEIRVRELEIYGNWLPLIEYFISIYRWVDERMGPEFHANANANANAIEEPIVIAGMDVRKSEPASVEGGNFLENELARYTSLCWNSPFLASGQAGYALALHQAAISIGSNSLLSQAKSALADAILKLDELPLSSSLYSGLTGIGLAAGIIDQEEFAEVLGYIDVALGEGLLSGRNPKLDMVDGIAGIIIYGISRQTQGKVEPIFTSGINFALAEIFSDTARSPLGGISDLGMAHGLAGLLAAATAGVECGLLSAELTRPIAHGYSDLWSTVGKYQATYCAPSMRDSTSRSRVAWCYGSLGAAVSFLQGAALFPENTSRATALMDSAILQIRSGTHAIVDASVCHGWAGCAILFDYMSRHRSVCSRAMRMQLRQEAESMISIVSALGTRSEWRFPFVRGAQACEAWGLLEGSLGVVCAVAAIAERSTPAWTSMLGLTPTERTSDVFVRGREPTRGA